jgi:hypothetical protein
MRAAVGSAHHHPGPALSSSPIKATVFVGLNENEPALDSLDAA